MSDSIERQDFPIPGVRGLQQGYRTYQQTRDEFELRDYYRIPVRRKWLTLAVLTSVLAAVAIQTFTTKPVYRSTARLRIDPEAANVLPYKEVMEVPESYLTTEVYLQTQYKILESRALSRRVIEKLNLADTQGLAEMPSGSFLVQAASSLKFLYTMIFSPKEATEKEQDLELIDLFLENLEVDPIRSTRLVDVSHTSYQPEFAEEAINTLVEEFIEQNFENKYNATIRAADFLEKQLEQLKITVEHSEEDLIRYARQHGILNIDERGNVVLQKLADLNQEMTRVQADLISKTARYQVVKDATVENFLQSLKNDLIIDLEKRFLELKQNLASLSARFGPDWPDVQNTGRKIQEVREQLRREKEDTIREAKIEYRVAQDHHQLLSSALEEQKLLANQLNEDSIQYNILKREVETSKQLYEGLLQRLKEAGVSAGLKSSNIQVVDRGEVPWKVYRPRKALNLALGLLVGLMLGVGLAFLTEYLDDTLKTPDQVEQLLALPSLGVIPAIGKPRDGTTHLLPAEGTTDAQSAAILPYTPAGSRIWEAYRSFRTSLVLSSSGQQPKTILVTSSFTGEGKTTTAINAGIVFAQTGARTLLIDLDMRKPMLARRFGMVRSDGMSTFLSGNSDLSSQIKQTAVRSLFVLPGGPIPPNPAELMGSERMEEVLSLLAQYFEYIVIDSPPVLSVTDALVLSPQVDGVVMVIHGGKTSRDAVRRAAAHLRDVGAKILGALINNVDMESSDYYYYYRHYYDYGYHETMDQADHVG